MKNVTLSLLLGSLLFHTGCIDSHLSTGLVVYVTDTIRGQQHVISTGVGADGKFAHSISKGNITQTMSGQVTKSGDEYIVKINYDYNCTIDDSSEMSEGNQIQTNARLREGQSRILAGQIMGDSSYNVTHIKISRE